MATSPNTDFEFKTIGQLDDAGPKTAEDLIEVFQNGESKKMTLADAIKFNAYDVGVGSSTQISNDNTITIVDNDTNTAKAIALPAQMPAGRGRTYIVVIRGNAGVVTWDDDINWSGNTAPTVAPQITVAVLLWDGTAVHGSAGASY